MNRDNEYGWVIREDFRRALAATDTRMRLEVAGRNAT